MVGSDIDLSRDPEKNTTCLESCNACIYNGMAKVDMEDIFAFADEDNRVLAIGPITDEDAKIKLRRFYDAIDTEKALEITIYPVSELAFHRVVFWCDDITVSENENGDLAVTVNYRDDNDEIRYEFTKLDQTDEDREIERIRNAVKREIEKREGSERSNS